MVIGATSVSAAGLSTRFGKVTVRNLRIGHKHSMKEVAKLPLVIFNNSGSTIEVKIDPMLPTQSELKETYEPIPDLSWIGLERDMLKVGPQMYGETDVFITIPEDEKYLEKKYQVFIWSRTVGKSIGLGLKSCLLFTIAPEKGGDESSDKARGDFDYSVDPHKIVLENVKPGQVFDLERDAGIVLKITNNGKTTKKFGVESVSVSGSSAELPEGYRECPFPSFLTLETAPEFELAPGVSSNIRMYLNLPDRDEYSGQKYMFLVKISQEGVAILTHVYVSTVEQDDMGADDISSFGD